MSSIMEDVLETARHIDRDAYADDDGTVVFAYQDVRWFVDNVDDVIRTYFLRYSVVSDRTAIVRRYMSGIHPSKVFEWICMHPVFDYHDATEYMLRMYLSDTAICKIEADPCIYASFISTNDDEFYNIDYVIREYARMLI